MMSVMIDGRQIAQNKKDSIAKEVAVLKEQGITPGLAVILVGENPASKTYVNNKRKTCLELGMHSVLIEMDEQTTEQQLLSKIEELNNDDTINGILVQLPLPKHIEEAKIIEAITPNKDVDGFHPVNVGKLSIGMDTFAPCTPAGIIVMLEEMNIEIEGKHVVVVGRSNIVGKPAGQLFLNKSATVTYCHSRTKDLAYHTKQADILVVAVGIRNIIGKEHVKPGAVVIDVGMNRNDLGKLCGDVDFEEVKEISSFITPVPGGVGPMTITMLMYNTLKAAKVQNREKLLL